MSYYIQLLYVNNFLYREAIKEDDHGLLEASVADIIHNAKRKRQMEKKVGARLGMMRHLYVILDASESMSLQDLKPTRFLCSLKVPIDTFILYLILYNHICHYILL